MGKAQSKRSVDITTDNKKAEEEVTEKVEKIEDIDHEAVNVAEKEKQEKNPVKKEELNVVNNDKGAFAENNVDAHAGGDSAHQNKAEMAAPSNENDSVNGDDASALAEDTLKKTKKEKVKKKWSFRNISFGRKDKQKPSKTEEVEENSPTEPSNGNVDEKSSITAKDTEDGAEDQLLKVEEDTLEKSVENHDDLKSADEKFVLIPQTEEKLPEQENDEAPQTSTIFKKENDIEDLSDTAQNETERIQAQTPKDENNVTIETSLANSNGKLDNFINGFTDNVPEASNCDNVDEDLSNKAIPAKIISETMTFSKENHINSDANYQSNSEQTKPQIEVISEANTIAATVDTLSFTSDSPKTQDQSEIFIQSNGEILDIKQNVLPDFIEAVIEHEQVEIIEKDNSLPPPIPTSPLPSLAPSSYSTEHDIELIENNESLQSAKNDSVYVNEESNAIETIERDEHMLKADYDTQMKPQTEQYIISHNGLPNSDMKAEPPIDDDGVQKVEDLFELGQCTIGLLPMQTNKANNCDVVAVAVANVIDEITERAIEILDQQHQHNVSNNKLVSNNTIAAIANVEISTTEVDGYISKDKDINNDLNDLNVSVNGVEEESKLESQLSEQFERKLCIISGAENGDKHGNLELSQDENVAEKMNMVNVKNDLAVTCE